MVKSNRGFFSYEKLRYFLQMLNDNPFFLKKKRNLNEKNIQSESVISRYKSSVISQKTVVIIKSYLSSNFNLRHKIKILSTNNLAIIKRCMININYRFKPLFLVKLRHFQKIIQMIDFFFRRKTINVVIIMLKSNFIFYNKIFIFCDRNKIFQY